MLTLRSDVYVQRPCFSALKATYRKISQNGEKILPLNRRDGFFENIAKDFQSEESAEKRVRKFLDTENTLYGFNSTLNLRLKFRSASHNLF